MYLDPDGDGDEDGAENIGPDVRFEVGTIVQGPWPMLTFVVGGIAYDILKPIRQIRHIQKGVGGRHYIPLLCPLLGPSWLYSN